MNEIFNLKRFLMIVQTETFSFRRHYLFSSVAVAAFAVISFFLSNGNLDGDVFGPVASVVIVIAPFMLYNDVSHKIKGVRYTMLPASNMEKWLAFWLQCIVFFPLVMVAIWLLLRGVESLVFPSDTTLFRTLFIGLKASSDRLIWLICIQSISMLGVMAFNRLKWQKTLGVIFLLQLLVTILGVFFFKCFGLREFAIDHESVNLFSSIHWLGTYCKIIFYAIFPFGLWLASFFKLQEQEL